MTILNYSQINSLCLNLLIPRPNYNNFIFQYFTILYTTGCRPEEANDITRWGIDISNNLILQPLKNNNPRLIEGSSVPPYFLDYVINQYNYTLTNNYRKFQLYYEKWIEIAGLRKGDKDCNLYLFRYRYVKFLRNSGFSYDEIADRMGWDSSMMAQSYALADIYF